MDELGSGQAEDDHGGTAPPGDSYYHPLTAAITVMHDMEPQQHQHQHHQDHQQQHQHQHHHQQQQQQQQVTLMYEYCRATDPSGEGSPVMGGALECKITNGVNEGGIGASPTEGLFFVGGAEGNVKREPEDLTRRGASTSPADRGALSDRRRVILPPPPPSVPSSGESPPSLEPVVLSLKSGELEHHVIKEELDLGPTDRRPNHTLVIQAPLDSGSSDKMSTGTGTYIGGFTSTSPGAPTMYEHVHSYLTSPSPQPYTTSTSPVVRGSPATVYSTGDPFYRDYYTTVEPQYTTARQDYTLAPGTDQTYVLDRYPRPPYKTNGVSGGLTVDLPSPADSGISADAITPRDQPQLTQTFGSYDDMTGQIISSQDLHVRPGSPTRPVSRPWHEFTRHPDDKIQIPKIHHTDDDKIHIPKIFSQYGFKYHLESPISISHRREDDRITYMNKGQFYGITMEYIHDPEKSIKPGTVKSVIMLMFREEKTHEDEIKAWQFWHSRQHSVKQRIIDVDTKNSVGLVGQIQELTHNAIVVYWNPLEQSAKISVAMQCLSTDFSSQTGVRGLPLHIQVDTYEDSREVSTLIHRGYCQIKVFCDKGAERKTRDEERRAAKRRMAATTRKKYEDLYHQPNDRSEFYSMADLTKPPVLFTPNEDLDKIPMDIQGFYSHDPENGDYNVGGVPPGSVADLECTSPSTNLSPQQQVFPNTPGRGMSPHHGLDPQPPHSAQSLTQPTSPTSNYTTITQLLPHSQAPLTHPTSPNSNYTTITQLLPHSEAPLSPKTNSFRLYYSFPQTNGDLKLPGSPSQQTLDLSSRVNGMDQLPYWKSDVRKDLVTSLTNGGSMDSPMTEVFTHIPKRSRLTPPLSERLMLYVRQNGENVYTPLHLVPPTTQGLHSAIEQKYKISPATIYRKSKCGVLAKVDDEMLRHYTNEDIFMMEVQLVREDAYEITLIELGPDH